MYTDTVRMFYSDLDPRGGLRVASVVNAFQNLTNLHAESVGQGWEKLQQERRAWMLCFWKIVLMEDARPGQVLTAETRPYAYDRVLARRCFGLKDADGRYLAMADAYMFLYNMDTGHPAVNERRYVEPYGCDAPLDMELADSRRILLPEEMKAEAPFRVRRSMLDTNHHVNNVQYISMTEDYMPQDRKIREYRIEYRKAARYGDTICPYICDRDGWRYAALCDPEGDVFAAVQMR